MVAKKHRFFKHRNYYKYNKRVINMNWLYGFGALIFGGNTLLLFFESFFTLALLSFTFAVLLAYIFEMNNN